MAKNTPGVQICNRGANLHPGANCAYKPSLSRKLSRQLHDSITFGAKFKYLY